ncbi:hypothetical protein LJB92_03880, partial [Bacteroidales bacterium OttesenSCG-928-M06]|nr:hypothetical protein [Bacteroidales bacterium OttesenSCG-928-M06]
MKKYIFFLAGLFLLSPIYSQSSDPRVHIQQSWELKRLVAKNSVYIARDTIRLTGNFRYQATPGNPFLGKIDKTLVFPPSDQSYMKENGEFTKNPTEGAAVGNLEGTLDVNGLGGAVYSVSIECPPGINGMHPTISLVYNSQAGNGIAGMGWAIGGLSMISRVPSSWHYDSYKSSIQWDKRSALVWDNQQIRAKNFNSTDSVIYYSEYGIESIKGYDVNDWGPLYFKVRTKEGLELQYGDPASVDSYFPLTRQGDNPLVSSNVKNRGWALTKIVDKNNNYIKYNYTADENIVPDGAIISSSSRITSIEYGNTTDNKPVGKIIFNYKDMSTPHVRYISGFLWKDEKILDNIEVQDYEKSLKTKYNLVYEEKNGNYFLLELRKENSLGEYLHPLKFEWNDVDYTFSQSKDERIPSSTEEGYDISNREKIYGDFTGDGISDIICKVEYRRWDENENKFKYKYRWIAYERTPDNPDHKYKQVYSSTFDNNNETIFLLADRDRDGKDELYIGRFFNETAEYYMTIKKYVYNEENSTFYHHLRDDTYSVYISQDEYVARGSSMLIPFDALNYGQVDFLLITGSNRIWYIDMNTSNSNRIEARIFADLEPENRIYITDINGNGKQELMLVRNNKTQFYEFSPQKVIYTSSKFSHDDFIYTGDFNGDGYTDFIIRKKEEQTNKVVLSTGSSLIDTNWGDAIIDSVEKEYPIGKEKVIVRPEKLLLDINKDGRTDIVISGVADGSRRITYLKMFISTGNGFKKITQNEYTFDEILFISGGGNINTLTSPSIFTYNRGRDRIYHVDINSNAHNHKIKKITNSFHQELNIAYKYLNLDYKYGANILKDVENPANYIYNSGTLIGFEVVDNIKGKGIDMDYDYSSAHFNYLHKGFLGFKNIKKTDNINSFTQETEQKYDSTHYLLYPYKTNVLTNTGDSISQNINHYTISTKASNDRFYTMQLDLSQTKDFLKGTTTKKSYSDYDNSGNPRSIKTDFGSGITINETYTYTNAGSSFNNKVSSLLTNYIHNSNRVIIRRDHYYYDKALGHLLLHTKDSLDGAKKVQTFYDSYDKYGNVTKSTTRVAEVSRSKSYRYSSTGRFLEKEIDHQLNDTITYQYDERKSQLNSKTDQQRRTTSYEYDGFGQLKHTTYPDGLKSVQLLQWAGDDAPEESVYYSYSESSGSSPVKVWYDAQGRELRSESYGVDNKKIRVDTDYYPYTLSSASSGKVKSVSEPYFEMDSVVLAVEYTYDELGRISKEKTLLGNTEYKYQDTITIVKSPRGEKVTKVNAAGWVISEKTNGKEVIFAHTSDGRVRAATPEGGMAIRMEYDRQGNRTKLIDPDAGTIVTEYDGWGQLIREEQYVHNAQTPVITTYAY